MAEDVGVRSWPLQSCCRVELRDVRDDLELRRDQRSLEVIGCSLRNPTPCIISPAPPARCRDRAGKLQHPAVGEQRTNRQTLVMNEDLRGAGQRAEMVESRHYIHYVSRALVVSALKDSRSSAFYIELDSELFELDRPRFHTTRAMTGPALRIKPGDVIWLVSQLRSPWGALAPSLDARILVDKIELLDKSNEHGVQSKRLKFHAGPHSRWFPLADATSVLQALQSRRADQEIVPMRHDARAGMLLRRPRELVSASPLIAWEERIDSIGLAFVSYRLVDGTQCAFDVVHDLMSKGGVVFWDRWSLPRRLAERREKLDPTFLAAYIEDNIRRCRAFIAVQSTLYGKSGSYSERELEFARSLGWS